jgi:hypothetical protein
MDSGMDDGMPADHHTVGYEDVISDQQPRGKLGCP